MGGCCSSNRSKQDLSAFKTVNLPEIFVSFDESSKSSYIDVIFIISEIKLTKVFEKITTFPCSISIFIETDISKVKSDIGDIWNYVHELKTPKRVCLRMTEINEKVTLNILCTVEDTDIEIGSTVLDIYAIENQFKGILTLTYRCLKSVFISSEIRIGDEPLEEMSLSFASPTTERSKSLYFPCIDYPVDLKTYFTPNFSNEKWNSGHITQREGSVDTIYILKNPKTQYNELKEYLLCSHPEIIYYTLERLRYFASQTVYASKIIQDVGIRIKEILISFSIDKLILNKCLWVLFELSKCLEANVIELMPLFDENLIKSLLNILNDQQIASLSLELIYKALVIVKFKDSVTYKQTALWMQILEKCKEYSRNYNYAEINSEIIAIVFAMISSINSSDSVKSKQIDIIFTIEIFEFMIKAQKTYLYNTEIILNSLKILKLFLNHKKYKQYLLENTGVKHLIPIAKFYTDQDIQKLMLNIIKEILGFALNPYISRDIHSLVLEIIKNNSENISIAETAIGILKIISADILQLLVNDESIETYCVLFICMKGEIDFEMLLLSLFKNIKENDEGCIEVLRKNKKIENCVLELLENYSIGSTGSQSSNESVYLKLKLLAEEVLGII